MVFNRNGFIIIKIDRSCFYVRFVGILSRAEDMFILPVQIHDGDDLAIIVENQGILKIDLQKCSRNRETFIYVFV